VVALAVSALGLSSAQADPTPVPVPIVTDPAPAPAPAPVPAPDQAPKAATDDGLSGHDQQLLTQARAGHQKTVTLILIAGPGQTGQLTSEITDLGGSITTSAAAIGYLRASVPTAAVERVAKLPAVAAVDLNETIPLPQPEIEGKGTPIAPAPAEAPGPGTPASNPYLPTGETDSVDFKHDNPGWDGRGVTIGVLDSGVSLDNPALQTTSTGERKIVDWVTGTAPLTDGDGTWRAMIIKVSGPKFTLADGTSWTAPAGNYRFNRFSESITAADQLGGDVNRDGDTTDQFGILYDPVSHDIRVDANQNNDFTDDAVMRPYRERFDIGHFGADNPATPVRDQVPFVVEFRKDVDLTPAGLPGQKADFVNIGITEDEHGSHVAGILAGNDMFGNADFDGQAPGAKLVSSRACSWGGGCTAAALTDGLVDLVVNRHVDVVNISIGGLPALNDGNNARALLYNLLIQRFGVQLFIAAGNNGPGLNTVGDPGVTSDVVSVAAAVSKKSWLANYGSVVREKLAVFPFSSRGPREDGGFKPNLTAPGSAISTIDSWLPGNPVPQAGYDLPPGYAMLQGTSMATPEATGAAALLLSAARSQGQSVSPAQLRRALYSGADFQRDIPADAQGNGFLDVPAAWKILRKQPAPRTYTATAPVCTVLAGFLSPPAQGSGLFNDCAPGAGGQAIRQARSYAVTLTRTSGTAPAILHNISWVGNDGTFAAPATVSLALNQPVTITVTATPAAGSHSAIMQVDDPATRIVDFETMNEVVASTALPAPSYVLNVGGEVDRNATRSYFVTVPAGTPALQVNLSGVSAGSQVRWIAISPYGVPVEPSSTLVCYPNFSDPATCNPLSRAYSNPIPGVWQLEVEARRTSPLFENPYQLRVALQGVSVTPPTLTLPSAAIGVATPVTWSVRNDLGPVTVHPAGGPLGSSSSQRPSISQGESQLYQVTVPPGASRLDVGIGNPADAAADLDLYLLKNGVVVAQSADGDAEEAVSLANPPAGSYQIEVDGYSVPAGHTEFDYRDVFFSAGLGTLQVPGSTTQLLEGSTTTISGSVMAAAGVAAGRQLFGEMSVLTDQGAVVGRGTVRITKVTG
jgi:subtilisin family serine protease